MDNKKKKKNHKILIKWLEYVGITKDYESFVDPTIIKLEPTLS